MVIVIGFLMFLLRRLKGLVVIGVNSRLCRLAFGGLGFQLI